MKYKDIKVGQTYYVLLNDDLFDAVGGIIKVKVIKKYKRYPDTVFIVQQAIDGYVHEFKIKDWRSGEGNKATRAFFPADLDKIEPVIFNRLQEHKRFYYRCYKGRLYLDCKNAKTKVMGEYAKLNKKQQAEVLSKISPNGLKRDGQIKVSKFKMKDWEQLKIAILDQMFPLKAL